MVNISEILVLIQDKVQLTKIESDENDVCIEKLKRRIEEYNKKNVKSFEETKNEQKKKKNL